MQHFAATTGLCLGRKKNVFFKRTMSQNTPPPYVRTLPKKDIDGVPQYISWPPQSCHLNPAAVV